MSQHKCSLYCLDRLGQIIHKIRTANLSQILVDDVPDPAELLQVGTATDYVYTSSEVYTCAPPLLGYPLGVHYYIIRKWNKKITIQPTSIPALSDNPYRVLSAIEKLSVLIV